MYTRYEIVLENKTVGLLAGLSEIISEKEADDLIEPFNQYLEIPWFYLTTGKNGKKNIYAYFTDLGLSRFSKEIDIICKRIEKEGYKINIKKQNKVGTARLIYEDKYQALIKSK